MSFDLTISAGSSVPIFRQIVDQVRLAVATGRVAAGEQLPSVRALAEKLVVNANTVAKAYNDLCREGIIDAQQGRGFFIAALRQIYTKAERSRRMAPLADALVHEGLSLGFAPQEILDSVQQSLSRLKVGGKPS